ncbi:MAG: hypothetical protein ACRCU9_06280 [Iodobacter sp.]
MNIDNPRGKARILSRVDFVRMASAQLTEAVLFLTYDTTDERTTKSRSTLVDYLSDIGLMTVAQALEEHHSIVMFELPGEALQAWQQVNDHSRAVAAHVFWHGLQDDAVHAALMEAKPREVSPLAHH